MRDDQRHKPNAVPADAYQRHRIALGLLQSCGFVGVGDCARLTRAQLLRNLQASRDALVATDFVRVCSVVFKRSVPNLDVDVKSLVSVLKFMEGITKEMYGLHVGRVSKSNKRDQASGVEEANTFVVHRSPLYTLDGGRVSTKRVP